MNNSFNVSSASKYQKISLATQKFSDNPDES